MVAIGVSGVRLLAMALVGVVALVLLATCDDMAMAGACGQGGPMGGRDTRPGLIYACSPVDVDGDPLYRLWRLLPNGATELSSAPAQDPAVAPSGSQLAYDGTAGGMPNIYVSGIAGGSPEEIAAAPGGQMEPAWSPDGGQLAYVSGQRGLRAQVGVSNAFGSIFVSNSAGAGGQAITPDGSYAGEPAWAPKDGRIAYATDQDGFFQVDTVAPNGAGRSELTHTGQAQWPTWSPNGNQVAYQSSSTLDGNDSIWIVNANGADRRFLTSGSRPSWSPNGKWIAFVRDTSQGSDLWMISPDGGHAIRITDDPGLKGRPTWVG